MMACSQDWVAAHADLVLTLRPHGAPHLLDAAEFREGHLDMGGGSEAADGAEAPGDAADAVEQAAAGLGKDSRKGVDKRAWGTGAKDKKAEGKVGWGVVAAYARSGSWPYSIGLVVFALLAQVRPLQFALCAPGPLAWLSSSGDSVLYA